jgi:hypothetical protein
MIEAVILGTKVPAFDGGSTDSIHICAENAAIGVLDRRSGRRNAVRQNA